MSKAYLNDDVHYAVSYGRFNGRDYVYVSLVDLESALKVVPIGGDIDSFLIKVSKKDIKANQPRILYKRIFQWKCDRSMPYFQGGEWIPYKEPAQAPEKKDKKYQPYGEDEREEYLAPSLREKKETVSKPSPVVRVRKNEVLKRVRRK